MKVFLAALTSLHCCRLARPVAAHPPPNAVALPPWPLSSLELRHCHLLQPQHHHPLPIIAFLISEFICEKVNVVKGLKLYDDIFTDVELSKLNDFVNELRVAGQNGELSGETFILYNQQTKGNKRELIQLGVPIFGQIKEDEADTFQKISGRLKKTKQIHSKKVWLVYKKTKQIHSKKVISSQFQLFSKA